MKRRDALQYVGLGAVFSVPAAIVSDDPDTERPRYIRWVDTVDQLRTTSFVAGDLVATLGYTQADDGGGALYRIQERSDSSFLLVACYEEVSDDLVATLHGLKSVNYRVFGAVGDGIHEDGEAIHQAHRYANKHRLPVENHSGTFNLGKRREIPIETQVDWGETVFLIDESQHTKEPVFHVQSAIKETITLSEGERLELARSIKPGVTILDALAKYKNHLIHLLDQKDLIGARAGSNAHSGRPKEELLYIEEAGKIVGDIAWEFRDSVTIDIIPLDSSFLTIQGGTFKLSGTYPTDTNPRAYVNNGILVSRSRTIIKNQWVGLESGHQDVSMLAQSGFYYFAKVYNVKLENVRLIPREKDREGSERDVPHGTYGIGANRVLGFLLVNVTSEGDWIHWGVMGTNMLKDVTVANCRINRFDVHFHLWNLTIRDSRIGYKGVNLTGGGQLMVTNTVVQSHSFLNFRHDYGAKWDGDITIRDCALQVVRDGASRVLSCRSGDHPYGYDIGLPRKIVIQNFTFNYWSKPDNSAEAIIIDTSHFTERKVQQSLSFPRLLHIEDVEVVGRDEGCSLMHLTDIEHYTLPHTAKMGTAHTPNAKMILRNIQSGKGDFLVLTPSESEQSNTNPTVAPYVSIRMDDLPHVVIKLAGIKADISIDYATVHHVQLGGQDPFDGEIQFANCRFEPEVFDEEVDSFQLEASHGASFTNCRWHMPRQLGEDIDVGLNRIGVFVLNESVRFNHINSRLGNDVMAHLKQEGITLRKKFLRDLFMHSSSQ